VLEKADRSRAAIRTGGKNWGDKRTSGISRLFGAAKLQSASGADNPHYATPL